MKKLLKKNFCVLLFFCSFFLFGTINVHAETTGSVPVTYTREESAKFILSVNVTGDGEVLSGEDTLRNQSKDYLLPIDESLIFELKADNGSSVKSVKLNGEDITNKVIDNKIIVEGENKDQTLSISFEKIKGGSFLPYTGDSSRIGIYLILLLLSGIAGGYLFFKDRKKVKN